MRFVGTLLIAALLSLSAVAQIVSLELTEKASKKYRKNVIHLNGRPYVIGEVKSGARLEGNSWQTRKGTPIVIWIMDPDRPDRAPYRILDGEKEEVTRKGTLSVDLEHMVPEGGIQNMMRDETILGLVTEYQFKLDRIEAIEAERDTHEKGDKAWTQAQRELIEKYTRLQSWLESTGFHGAAKRLGKKLNAESKVLKEDAVVARAARANGSIRAVAVPPELETASQDVTGGALKFKVQESQHIRLLYCKNLQDASAAQALRLGEEIIEGFRREFVDPWVDQGVEDFFSDDVMVEFFFLDDNVGFYEKLWEQFYGQSWGDGERRARRLAASGTTARGVRPGASYFHYWKSTDQTDFEGIVAHGLGHNLAEIIFNRAGPGSVPEWLQEASGYYAGFEYLGRNRVTCFQFKREEYARSNSAEEGMKTIAEGQRAGYNELALKKGRPLADLVTKDLFEMDDADLAKAWSFFDYVARQEGLKGVLWLIKSCDLKRAQENWVNAWREASVEILGIEGRDPLREMDERWASFAKKLQKKDDSRRRR